MRFLKNERGYALLIVLLLIVLVMSITATFMAGSLNHAKQEQTIDVSNQSVAAAEMGVLYYTTDFERSLELIKQEVLDQTGIGLNAISQCLKSSNRSACDTAGERDAWEKEIDENMKELYVEKILKKINELVKIQDVSTESFADTDSSYTPKSWTLVGVSYDETELRNINPNLVQRIIDVGELGVKANIDGSSKNVTKTLSGLFEITIPDTFLNPDEVFNVDHEIIAEKEDASYDDVFKSTEPTKSCTDLLNDVKAGKGTAPFECKMSGTDKLSDFIKKVTDANQNPKDFWIHVESFQKNVCDQNCNGINFQGANVVVKEGDAAVSDNMNNMENGNLIINGMLTAEKNMNNLGKKSKQTMVLKELNVDGHIKNLNYTNLLVLGNQSRNDARLRVGKQFQIDNYSNLCIDIDKILLSDLQILSNELTVTNGGKVIYYAAPDSTRTFKLNGVSSALNDVLVKRSDNYSTFLKNCGITINATQTVEISSPNVIDTEFGYEVDY